MDATPTPTDRTAVIITAFRLAESRALTVALMRPDGRPMAERLTEAVHVAQDRARRQLRARGYSDLEIVQALIQRENMRAAHADATPAPPPSTEP